MVLKVINYFTGLLQIRRKTDVWLVSFPKSGNTWIRFFYLHLANRIYPGRLEQDDIISFYTLDSNMPELGYSNLDYYKWKFPEISRLVKTHSKYFWFFSKNDIVYILRDPFDVMISYYRYELGKTNPRFKGTFSEFLRDPKFGVEALAKHFISWKPYIKLLIKYEDLKEDPICQFNRLLDFLKIEVPNDIIIQSYNNSKASNVKNVESKLGMTDKGKFSKEFSFVSSNKEFNFKELFSDSDITYMNKVLSIYNLPYER
ncbi:Sulfotransferase domain-containing protein [Algoriphagus locisalis]|uniref:Sulfotransferase domain-containing protein n=1 Tax=Algoriphagus locisalis TaxID=305507 RepID=A0A1I6Y5E9_9BACT|nr:sulfotransferase domain-containing protein [Algoriphagus locisalis]SFT45592.1 Sulfotransferase domain-containing protein [Algoriphagus locisalis]